MSKDLDDEREVLEVVEFSESEDEGFDYKEVEVRTHAFGMSICECLYIGYRQSTIRATADYLVCAALTHGALRKTPTRIYVLL